MMPGKDPTLPLPVDPDTVGKLFEKVLLARVLREVNPGDGGSKRL
jgi:hypothetical protein